MSRIKTGYIIALILLLISFFLIFQSNWKMQREYNRIANSFKIENKIAEIGNLIFEAEARIRGYYITRNETFLRSSLENSAKIPQAFNEIRILSEDKEQLARLDTLNQLVDLRLSIMKTNVEAFQKAGGVITEGIHTSQERSNPIMDSINLYVYGLIRNEQKVAAEQNKNLISFFTSTRVIAIISLLTAVLAIFYSLFIYNKESKSRHETAQKNIQYQKELESHINELKRIDAEVKELKSMEKFTATGRIARTIAHEVRNPLTNISLAAEQLHELSNKSNESSMLLDMISRNAIRINQLVADLLNATKVLELNVQKVSINKILDETLEMAADRIGLDNIKVEKNYSSDICKVAVDEQKIKVVFLNIIINAIEAVEKNKGVLIIRTTKEGNKCIVSIEDNGVGMDDDTIQKLFDPYFTNKPKGNGLGLTNSQNIILSHKGKISIQSKPGKGSIFTVTLQIAD